MTKLRKVLLYYVPRPPIMAYLQKAFTKQGVQVICSDAHANNWVDKRLFHFINKQAHNFRILPKSKNFFESHPLTQRNYREAVLKQQFDEFKPDLCFMIRGLFGIQADTIKYLQRSSRLFGWWIESDDRVDQALAQAKDYETFYVMNSSLHDAAISRGIHNTRIMHHAVDPEAFYPIEGIKKDIDICFVGSWSASRQKALESVFQLTKNVVIYGRHWRKRLADNAVLQSKVLGEYIGGHDLVVLYNRSRIVFNYTGWGNEQTRSGFTMRTLEVPACKSLLLTDYSKDIEKIMTSREHLIMFKEMDEALENIESILSNSRMAQQIATDGYEKVISCFTYDVIVRKIIEGYEKQ
ncbi:CgeB family protein [Leeia oryzae]|uniref:CgeB family protein n=1 Tax=Leeia oryzae TaxID=356662 RepID=UPI00039BEE05|nr:glycosyltransferase [Leeia oryzae]